MSIVAVQRRSSIPGYEEWPCAHCNAVVLTPASDSGPVVCRSCRREHAEQDLHELQGHLANLRAGAEPFDVWTAKERRERLGELLLGDDGHCCFGAPAKAAQVTRELAEGVKFETPSLSDLDAMADTIEAAELVEA